MPFFSNLLITLCLIFFNGSFSYHFKCLPSLRRNDLRSRSSLKDAEEVFRFLDVNSKLPVRLPDLSQKAFPDICKEDEFGCNYDLVVIGSGPGGEAAAVVAARLGKRVAVIEKKNAFGGPTGLTSKAVREATKRICAAIDQIGGDRRRQVKRLWKRIYPALKSEAEVLQVKESRDKLDNNGIDVFIGTAKFVPDSNQTLQISGVKPSVVRVLKSTTFIDIKAHHVCIATGSRPHYPKEIAPGSMMHFKKGKVMTASEIVNMDTLPNAAAIIGGGVIAVEYATVLAKLGVGVTLLCKKDAFLPFLEKDLRQALYKRLSKNHVLIVHDPITAITVENDGTSNSTSVRVSLAHRGGLKAEELKKRPERKLKVDAVLYSGGRDANSEGLDLHAIGAKTTSFGRISVDPEFRTTAASNVYAIGDVIGPPGLASAAQHQATQLVDRLFGSSDEDEDEDGDDGSDGDFSFEGGGEVDFFSSSEPFEQGAVGDEDDGGGANIFGSEVPLTLWTIPEIASVGLTQAQLLQKVGGKLSTGNSEAEHYSQHGIVEGVAYFKDMARGRLSGDMDGFLKVVAIAEQPTINKKRAAGGRGRRGGRAKVEHRILGVHIFGEGANELVQLGSVLVHSKATAEQVRRTPFAAVTLSGLFQMACDDIVQRVAGFQGSSTVKAAVNLGDLP